MKYLKMLGLAAIAAAALTAFIGTGTASATTLTSAGGLIFGAETEIHATSEGKVVLETAIGKIECDSTTTLKTENEGGGGLLVTFGVEAFTWGPCSAAFAAVPTKGVGDITGIGGNNGEIRSNGFELTVEKNGFHCIYRTNLQKVGTVTGSATTGATPTIDISATITRTGGKNGAFCGMSGTWKGSYKINTPDTMNIDV
jgi:hypothetical protein